MKHAVKKRKLGRTRDEREGLLRTLAVSLVRDRKIETTEAKAKELRPYIEKLISAARKDTVASRRLISSKLGTNKENTARVFEVAKQYVERPGGYTRVVKLGRRRSDSSPIAIIEFV